MIRHALAVIVTSTLVLGQGSRFGRSMTSVSVCVSDESPIIHRTEEHNYFSPRICPATAMNRTQTVPNLFSSGKLSDAQLYLPTDSFGIISGFTTLACPCQTHFDIRSYGAKLDGQAVGDGWAAGSNQVSDCWTTSGSMTLQCSTAHFSNKDVGKVLLVNGGAASGETLKTTIAAYVSPTQITMANAAGMTMSSTTGAITGSTWAVVPTPTTVTCSTNCNVSVGQWVAIQNANQKVYNTLVQVNTTPDSTHFTFLQINGTDPSYPLTSATFDGRSPRVVWGTDDTAAIMAAVNAAGDNGGGKVYFPAGITLATYIPLGCSKIGTFIYGTCTHAYNNVELSGAGPRISTIEGINVTPSSDKPALIGVGGPVGGSSGLAATAPDYESGNDWLRGFKLHDLTIRQPLLYVSGTAQAIIMSSTWKAEIYNAEFMNNKYECLYAMNNYGAKIHDNTAGPCGLSAYNMANESSEVYNNTALVSAQCGELGDTFSTFRNNYCDMRGRSSVQYGLNIGSTVKGIWENSYSSNTLIGMGIYLTNVNGMACNNHILNNTIKDGIVQVYSGKDVNLVNQRINTPTCPTGHGSTEVSGNLIIGDLTPSQVTLEGPESFVFENNTLIQRNSRCGGGTNTWMVCSTDADCPGSYCRAGNSARAVGIILSSGGNDSENGPALTAWKPNQSYPQYHYIVPSVPNGYMYVNLGATGTSDSSTEPTWCTTTACTVTDCGVTWTNRGPVATIAMRNNSLNVEHPPVSSDVSSQPQLYWMNFRSLLQVDGLTANIPYYMYGLTDFGLGSGTEPPYPNKIPTGATYSESNRWWTGTTPPKLGYWRVGTRIWRTDPTTSATGWVVTTSGWAAPSWTSGQSCAFGLYVVPTSANTHFYRATNATTGTTSTSEPTWPTTTGGSVADGTCTWVESGTAAVFTSLNAASAIAVPSITSAGLGELVNCAQMPVVQLKAQTYIAKYRAARKLGISLKRRRALAGIARYSAVNASFATRRPESEFERNQFDSSVFCAAGSSPLSGVTARIQSRVLSSHLVHGSRY